MSVSMKLSSMKIPFLNPRSGIGSKALNASPSLRFSIVAPRFKVCFQLPQRRNSSFNTSTVVFAASHEKPSVESDEIKEAWKQTLAAFREQAIETQGVSEEAYEIYSKRAKSILKRTSEQLKIEAEKAGKDLSVVAKERSEDGKRYRTEATKISPEVEEVVEPSSLPTDRVKYFPTLLDCIESLFYLCFTNGWIIVFMVTGSTSAILASALFAFSVESWQSHNKGKTCPVALQGQEAIAIIICVNEFLSLFQKVILRPSSILPIHWRLFCFFSRFICFLGVNEWKLLHKTFKRILSKTRVIISRVLQPWDNVTKGI